LSSRIAANRNEKQEIESVVAPSVLFTVLPASPQPFGAVPENLERKLCCPAAEVKAAIPNSGNRLQSRLAIKRFRDHG
jgi:hypothetical protein